jgi:integrase
MLRVNVLPHFGGWPVGRIEAVHVRQYLADLRGAGAGPGTVRSARKVLRLVLATAIEGGALRANPCSGIRLARSEPVEMAFLTMGQVLALATAMRRPDYGLLVRFAALTGLRAGEIGALRVGRLDLLRSRADVAETVAEVTGHGLVYGPPKTYERRGVPIPRTLAEELGAHLARRPHQPEDFVFTAPGGGPLRHHNFYRRHFKPALTAAGLPERVRFHDMRHTCAALLINADPPAHPLAVMKRLGHSSITVTYNTYGHLFPALEEALTESLERSYRAAQAAGGPDRLVGDT